MPFTTLTFIGFFAVVFFGYYAVPRRVQWMWLLLAGLCFYGYASLSGLAILLATVVLSYFAAVRIGHLYALRDETLKANKGTWSRDERKAYKEKVAASSRRLLSVTLVALFGILVAFKYLQFVLENLARLCGFCGWSLVPPELGWILPVGLSFYLFQTVGYLIDVYRESALPERNFLRHALFVSYFPQILQGPIGNYGELAPQLTAVHDFDPQAASFGLQRIVWGFIKKLCVANRIALIINPFWSDPSTCSGALSWLLVSFLYAIQIYADFSGYMDIACGCSQMLGIRLAENFNCPYFAADIPDYWRRWHMTLGSWFKDYLFYPILRSDWNTRLRKCFVSKYWSSVLPTAVALSIVWLTTGLWHGAAWGYIAWGVYYGIFIILNLLTEPWRKGFAARFPRIAGSRLFLFWNIAVTFAIVVVGYSIFKPGDLGVTWSIWKSSLSSVGLEQLRYFLQTKRLALEYVFGGVFVMFIVDCIHCFRPKGWIRDNIARLSVILRFGVYLVGLWLVVFIGRYGAGLNQFEYFKF